MRKLLTILVVVSVLALPAVAAPTLEEIREDLKEKTADWTSLKADLQMTMNLQEGPMPMSSDAKGTIEVLKEDGVEKTRVDLTVTIQEVGLEQKITTISDGTDSLVIMEIMGQRMAIESPAEEGQHRTPVGDDLIAELEEEFELTVQENEIKDGVEYYVIHGAARDPEGFDVRVHINKKLGLAHQFEMIGDNNEETVRVVFSNAEINPTLDAARFSMEIPDGVIKMDADAFGGGMPGVM